MFFTLSKTLGLLAQPIHAALFLLSLAVLLRLLRRAPILRRWLVLLAAAEIWIFSTGVVANTLLYPLETRHTRPAHLDHPPGAIVMLSGLTDPKRRGSDFDLTEAADRFVEAVRLAHKYPRTPLLISGGSSSLLPDAYNEARALGRLAQDLGVPARRLLIDLDSRNTRENAVESARLLREARVKGLVLLVTSAFHMPRAVACFDKVGLKVVPWPVDYLRTANEIGAFIPGASFLQSSTTALREYLGWLSYWLAEYV
jgi:uncharacterized SAM-binding protein YcdF (DUF218 family)